jgi:predicted nucleic-acid-binding Zn-ribbon protein
MDKCPKCSSTNRKQGEILPRGTLWDVRYQAKDDFLFSFKKKIIALACLSCGHIELLLKDIAGEEEG